MILPRPTLQAVFSAGATNVTLTWDTVVGGTNQLQYNTNLSASIWITLSNIVASGTSFSVTDIPPAGDPKRFYRVLAQ